MTANAIKTNHSVRLLSDNDLDRVSAIDRVYTGYSRRGYFEKRFTAAKSNPKDFIHIGVTRGGSLRGFVMARVLRGEFGRTHDVAVLDGLGVEPESRALGIGQTLLNELIRTMRGMGVRSLQSQAEWTNRDLLRFFSGSGFTLAPRFALERSVVEPLAELAEDV